MSKNSPHLLRSQSYLNILHPCVKESSVYATCPPLKLHLSKENLQLAKLVYPKQSKTQCMPSFRIKPLNIKAIWRPKSTKILNKSMLSDFEIHYRIAGGGVEFGTRFDSRHKLSHLSLSSEKSLGSKIIKSSADSIHSIIIQRSLPLFEVLPPLLLARDKSLFYQNAIILDGLKYRCFHDCEKVKFNLSDCIKNFNQVAIPSDNEIVFGKARILNTKVCGWEKSRLDWLVELERQQDFRMKSNKTNCCKNMRCIEGSKSKISHISECNHFRTNKTCTHKKRKSNLNNKMNEMDKQGNYINPDNEEDYDENEMQCCCLPFVKHILHRKHHL